ncbi:LIM/homeobox protein Lhx5, partial [Fragariocoptes setiger]
MMVASVESPLGYTASTKERKAEQETTKHNDTTKTINRHDAPMMLVVCAGCGKPIIDRFIFSVLERSWHANCVTCSECTCKLIDKCFVRDGKIYCREHFYRRFGIKCSACCEGIGPTDLVQRVRQRVYHSHCFGCNVCNKRLAPGEELYIHDDMLICKHHFVEAHNNSQQQQTTTESCSRRHQDHNNSDNSNSTNTSNSNAQLPTTSSTCTKATATAASNSSHLTAVTTTTIDIGMPLTTTTTTTSASNDDNNTNSSTNTSLTSLTNITQSILTSSSVVGATNGHQQLTTHQPKQLQQNANSNKQRSDTSVVTTSSFGLTNAKSDHQDQDDRSSDNDIGPRQVCAMSDLGNTTNATTTTTTMIDLSTSIGGADNQQHQLASNWASNRRSPASATSSTCTGHLYSASGLNISNSSSSIGVNGVNNSNSNSSNNISGNTLVTGQAPLQPQQPLQVSRCKRMRTSFKHHQLRAMKAHFHMNQNPDAKDLKILAQKTGLTKRVLQVWFQNARAKFRRNSQRETANSTPSHAPIANSNGNANGNNNNGNGNGNGLAGLYVGAHSQNAIAEAYMTASQQDNLQQQQSHFHQQQQQPHHHHHHHHHLSHIHQHQQQQQHQHSYSPSEHTSIQSVTSSLMSVPSPSGSLTELGRVDETV